MVKYELVPEQLLHEGTITAKNLIRPEPCPDEVLLWTHDSAYLSDLKNLRLSSSHTRRIGFPLSEQLVKRELVITQGTIDCSLFALEHGVALNVAGGTHHAFPNRGEGFCLLNDMAVAANYLLHHRLTEKILIVDLDVHQGNGTAKIFENEPRVFTFSMHGGHNYPFIKENSDLDLPLPDGIGDDDYLDLLSGTIESLLRQEKPTFIYYLSGVDILDTDKYGKLKISPEGCRKRDELVLKTCKQHRIPCTVAMGGGYSADIRIIVEAHCNTFRTAIDLFE
jgi:acetoin utilization deacetylase AcuC-like enzyme